MKIYIGNISFDTNEDELRDTFSEFGEVSKVDVITDKMTGKPRGFAFVEMSKDDEARAAIAELNGTELAGRRINVNEARAREERGGGGGGYRGGNRGGGSGGGGGYRDRGGNRGGGGGGNRGGGFRGGDR